VRWRIVALLQDYPDGLTPAEMRTLLGVDKSLADTCLGMLRYGLVQRVGRGTYGATATPSPPRRSDNDSMGPMVLVSHKLTGWIVPLQ
jgi:hypothetical protein